MNIHSTFILKEASILTVILFTITFSSCFLYEKREDPRPGYTEYELLDQEGNFCKKVKIKYQDSTFFLLNDNLHLGKIEAEFPILDLSRPYKYIYPEELNVDIHSKHDSTMANILLGEYVIVNAENDFNNQNHRFKITYPPYEMLTDSIQFKRFIMTDKNPYEENLFSINPEEKRIQHLRHLKGMVSDNHITRLGIECGW